MPNANRHDQEFQTGRCPSESALALFASGQVGSGAVDAIRLHIHDCADCRMIVGHLAMSSIRQIDSNDVVLLPDALAADRDTIGGNISRYQVSRQLGKGAMGVVYEGHDPDLRRNIAIKVVELNETWRSSPGSFSLWEAQVMAKISHPNVIAVFDVGIIDNQMFIVMELADHSLRNWLHSKPQPWRDIVAAFVASGQGLVAAHGRGVVHRDFKSDNVLGFSHSKGTQWKVADFGLAHAERDSDPQQPIAGISHMVIGTPAYMSPEQWRGEPATQHSDQFSFCAALYEALWNQRAFAGATSQEVRSNVVAGNFQSPPDSEVPRRVVHAIKKGMSNQPAQRFATMSELITQLSPVKRTKWMVLAVFASGTAAAAALAASPIGSSPAADPCADVGAEMFQPTMELVPQVSRALRKSSFVNQHETAQRIESIIGTWRSEGAALVQTSCRARLVERSESVELHTLRLHCVQQNLQRVSYALQDLLHPTAQLTSIAVPTFISMVSLDHCRGDRSLLTPNESPEGIVLGRLHDAMLQRLTQLRELTETLADSAGEQQVYQSLGELALLASQHQFSRIEAQALSIVAAWQARHGELKESLLKFENAQVAAERSGNDETRAKIMLGQAAVLLQDNTEQGVARRSNLIDQARALAARTSDQATLAKCDKLETLVHVLQNPAKSVELMRSFVEQSMKSSSELDLCSNLNGFANLLLHVEQFNEARLVTQRAIDIRQRVLGERHPSLQRLYTLMAKIQNAAEEPSAALQWSNKSIDLIKMNTSEVSLTLLGALIERSTANGNLGKFSDAVVDASFVIDSSLRGRDSNTLLEAYRVRANAWYELRLGHNDRAARDAESALTLQQQIWPGAAADSSMLGLLSAKRQGKYPR
jgi:eukaryotic-like serine/threonine-protein kinase